MKSNVLYIFALLAFCVNLTYAAPIDSGPIPANLIIQHNGLDWTWASAVSVVNFPFPVNVLEAPSFRGADGWRYATAAEWANRPAPSQFIVNFLPIHSASYWNSYDFGSWNFPQADMKNGNVTYQLGGAGEPGWVKQWDIVYVRNSAAAPIPEPSTLILFGVGFLSIFGYAFRKKRRF